MEALSIEQLLEAISNPDESISSAATALVEKKFAELEAKPKAQGKNFTLKFDVQQKKLKKRILSNMFQHLTREFENCFKKSKIVLVVQSI